ncbi:helix-turn-helix domain-containing protein [Actinoplanes sp. NPDC051861]|uniref:helix-turn-helix domain-containing protein n=1 Tax=Actinoplanes sp. NPDC051861 TaxID=3155170 RepID=UPI003446FD5F
MSKARLVITAVVIEGRSQAETARAYGVSKGWVSKLIARYRAEGEAAFEPHSRRPNTSPAAIGPSVVELIVAVRKGLAERGLDAGPETIRWHLQHTHHVTVSRATIARHLAAQNLVVPEPASNEQTGAGDGEGPGRLPSMAAGPFGSGAPRPGRGPGRQR